MSQTNYQDSLFTLSQKSKKKDKVEILIKLSESFQKSDSSKCVEYAKDALNLSKEIKYKEGEAEAYLQLGRFYFQDSDRKHSSNIELSNEYYAFCLNTSKEINYFRGLAYSYFYYGAIAWRSNNLSQTLEYYLLSVDNALKINDLNIVSVAYNNIADIYFQNEQYDDAIEYYEKCIEYSTSEFTKGIAYLGMGTAQFKGGCKVKSQNNINTALEILKKVQQQDDYASVFLLFTYQALAELAIDRNDFEEAEKKLALAKNIEINFASTETLYWYAQLYFKEKNSDLAIKYAFEYLNQSLNDMKQWRVHVEKVTRAYLLLAQISESTNNYTEAYKFLTLHNLYSDSTISFNQSEKIIELTKLHEAEIKKHEIETNILKERTNNLSKKILISIIVVLILFVAFLASIIRYRIKIHKKDKLLLTKRLKIQQIEIHEKRLEQEKELEIQKKQKEISDLKLQTAQNQIVNQEKELLSNATHILHINQKLEEILIEAKKIQPYLNSEGKKLLLDLIRNFKIENENESWNDFKHKFDLLHANFYINLSEKYPSLTSTEKKICALLTIEMSTTEIASILSKSYNSMNVAISRIRQKTNCAETDDLKSLLKTIEK